jgi:hypothetical protein
MKQFANPSQPTTDLSIKQNRAEEHEAAQTQAVDSRRYNKEINRLGSALAALSMSALPAFAVTDTNNPVYDLSADAKAEQILNTNVAQAEAEAFLKAYRNITDIASQLCSRISEDQALSKDLYDLGSCVSKFNSSPTTIDQAAKNKTASLDPDSLDLTIPKEYFKNLKTGAAMPNKYLLNAEVEKVRNSIQAYGAELEKINWELGFTKNFESMARPSRSLVNEQTVSKLPRQVFWVPGTNNKEYGYGDMTITKRSSKVSLSPGVNGLNYVDAPKYGFGNFEILTAMKALSPIVKKVVTSIFGADEKKLEIVAELRGSLHANRGFNRNFDQTPFNPVHAAFTMSYDLGGGAKFVTALFNNSNGYGGPDLRRDTGSVTTNYHSVWNNKEGWKNEDYSTHETTKTSPINANRLILASGLQLNILNMGGVSVSALVGGQYGYKVGDTKLTPAATLVVSVTDKKSPLYGLSFNIVPGVKINGKEMPAIVSSTAVINIPFNL